MKCKGCGANYKTKELSCPYCGKDNSLGRIWNKEKVSLDTDLSNTREEINDRIFGFVVNKILGRVLFFVVLFFVLYFLSFIFISLANDASTGIGHLINGSKYEKKMQEFVDNEDYSSLYVYMSEHELFIPEKYYSYAQAALRYSDYIRFKTVRMQFFEEDDSLKFSEGDYATEYMVKNGLKVLRNELGIYEEPDPANDGQYRKYEEDIRSAFIGLLGMTDEEIDKLVEADYTRIDDLDKLFETLRERSGAK